MLLRPIAYRLHTVLPEATPVETLYEVRLDCRVSATAHIRALLLSTIGQLPLTLQSVRSQQDDDAVETQFRAEVITAGRNNEVLEQIVMRLSLESDVSNLSWTIVESAME
jgi:putative Mg2+ transporter-C (MgtC) family protein